MQSMKKATNKRLRALFEGVDAVQLKNGGACDNEALQNEVVLRIEQPLTIEAFARLLEIDEPEQDFFCLCSGDYAIELFINNKRTATIGLHHGTSIRYYKWSGDANLKAPTAFLELLDRLGLKAPLQEKKQLDLEAEEAAAAVKHWLNNSPACFAAYIHLWEISSQKGLPELKAQLREEFPDPTDRIIALLKSYGTTYNYNTGYPVYEDYPRQFLDDYSLDKIIGAFLAASHSPIEKLGLERYLYHSRFNTKLLAHYAAENPRLVELVPRIFAP